MRGTTACAECTREAEHVDFVEATPLRGWTTLIRVAEKLRGRLRLLCYALRLRLLCTRKAEHTATRTTSSSVLCTEQRGST
jgi:hypothetical protein